MIPLKIVNIIKAKVENIEEISFYKDEPLSFDSKIVEHISIQTQNSKIELYSDDISRISNELSKVYPFENTTIVISEDGVYIRHNTNVITNSIRSFIDGIIEIRGKNIEYVPKDSRLRYVVKKIAKRKFNIGNTILVGRFHSGFHEPISLIRKRNNKLDPIRLYLSNIGIIDKILNADNIDVINTGFLLTNIIQTDDSYFTTYGRVENVNVISKHDTTLITIGEDYNNDVLLNNINKGLVLYDSNIMSLYYNNLNYENNIRLWIINNEPKFVSVSNISNNWITETIKVINKLMTLYNAII